MTDETNQPPDEPTGPAAWAHKLYGRPAPTTETPTNPDEWHRRLYNREANR